MDQAFEQVLRHRQWNVGILGTPISGLLRADIPRVRWLEPRPYGRFLADPFGAARDGRRYVVCEEFDYRRDRGTIVALELQGESSAVSPRVVIDEPFHLSYPYLFEHDGEVYCVPEAPEAPGILIYRAVEFPWRWMRAGVAIADVTAADPTIFKHEDRWWLTYTDNREPVDERLFVWHAPTPLGPWKPHASNPVKVDRSSARPGGTPFVHGGSLFRPAQDCSRTYGARVVINRVLDLSPTTFREEPAAVVGPDPSGPYRDGAHTVSTLDGATLVDGFSTVFIPRAVPAAAKRELRKTIAAIRAIIRS